MPEPSSSRADRILDAAGDQLVRLGYRKVTIDDIAKQAGVGKGTVYLHWRTKELLFEALIMRESVELVGETLAALRSDPAEVLPHRFLSTSFLLTTRRPLMQALLTRDMELLGKLAESPAAERDLLAMRQFFDVMTRHGLLLGEDEVPHLSYTVQAAVTGFYLLDNLNPETARFDARARAEGMAHVVRSAFEPATEPDPGVLTTAAAELATVFEDLIACYRTWIYSHGPAPEPGRPDREGRS